MCSALLSRGWSTPVFCAPPRAPCSKPSTTCLSTPSRDHVLEDLDMLAPGFGAPSISVGLEGRIEGSPKVPRERKQLCSVCTHACLSMHVPGDTCGPGSGRWWRRWWRRWRQWQRWRRGRLWWRLCKGILVLVLVRRWCGRRCGRRHVPPWRQPPWRPRRWQPC